MRKIIAILILTFAAGYAYGQGTPKDTVNVLSPAEISAGTLVDSVNIYHVQGGSWKKNTMANLATYLQVKDTLCLIIACSDETSDLTTGTAKVTFRAPYAMTVTAVKANVNTAPAGSTIIVDINEAGSSILGTKLSIDASEKTSVTAASAATITDSTIANDAEMTIDIDQIGSSTAGKGLKVHIYYIKG
jgi:hypothetical protein